MTGGKMNQIPAPASRLWEAGIRKLNTTMAIRRGSSVFPTTAPALIDGDPAVALSVVASSNTIYGYDVVETDAAESAATEDNDEDDDADEEEEEDEEEEDDESAASVTHSEQLLPSGDFYQGGVRDDLPHGSGKFLWTDGSMYEGSWRRGRASGRGKFSWPSGATYEGDLAGGYMHGHGTYIGEFGDTFGGHWANNFRHGRGTQAYANGDVYDGHWRDGRQDGHGRYIWRYGHEYIGTWKAGEMHGCGTVIWADGDRYDGAWEDAKPKGQGTFRWADGSMYIGLWWQEQDSGETNAKSGVYYPPSGGPAVPMPPREPREAITKLLEELEVTEGKADSLLPSQKIVTWPGVEAVLKKPVWRPPEPEQIQGRRSSAHGGSSVSDMDSIAEGEEAPAPAQTQTLFSSSEDAQARAASVERAWLRATSCMRAPPKPAKKQGETISKGHKNYELMLNLQLGIRCAGQTIGSEFESVSAAAAAIAEIITMNSIPLELDQACCGEAFRAKHTGS
jgi:1-phosphatidylinositol-4-phosphate 5-kinase